MGTDIWGFHEFDCSSSTCCCLCLSQVRLLYGNQFSFFYSLLSLICVALRRRWLSNLFSLSLIALGSEVLMFTRKVSPWNYVQTDPLFTLWRMYKNGNTIPKDDSLDYGANFAHMLGFSSSDMHELMKLYVTIHRLIWYLDYDNYFMMLA